MAQADSEFVEYLLELMKPIGAVRAKRMFGGYGLFLEGLMFALVADDRLYFKVGDSNLADFEQRGLGAFTCLVPASYGLGLI